MSAALLHALRTDDSDVPPVVRRAGGWFATTGPNGWSGPWASEAAAECAERQDYDTAWAEQRKAGGR